MRPSRESLATSASNTGPDSSLCGQQNCLRVLAFCEATSVTGPLKNILQFARMASDAFAPLPMRFSILTFRRGLISGADAMQEAAMRAGIPVQIVRERSAFDLAALPQIKAIVARHDPDLIQTHNVKSHFLVRLLGLHRRCPWIAFHHGYTWVDLKMRLYNRLDRWSLRGADHIVTVCHAFQEQLSRRGLSSARITVVHNSVAPPSPVSPDKLADLRRTLGVSPGQLVLLSVGRISPEKGYPILVQAMHHLLIRKPELNVKLVIVGEGKQRPEIERLCHGVGVAPAVVFSGHQHDIEPFYGIAAAVVIASFTEGSPNVLLESMAHGLPVVATRVGGIPEIITDGEDGILVEPGQSQALADVLYRVLKDPTLRERLGKKAKQTVSSRFTPELYYQRLSAVYRKVWQDRYNRASHA